MCGSANRLSLRRGLPSATALTGSGVLPSAGSGVACLNTHQVRSGSFLVDIDPCEATPAWFFEQPLQFTFGHDSSVGACPDADLIPPTQQSYSFPAHFRKSPAFDTTREKAPSACPQGSAHLYILGGYPRPLSPQTATLSAPRRHQASPTNPDRMFWA